MNIFYTYNEPTLAAQSLPDKLVVKMPLESAQMLSTAQRFYFGEDYCDELGIYKTAYLNHPCTIWARVSLDNYEWLFCYALALNDEYRYRYGKEHKSVYDVILKLPDIILPRSGLTPFAQAMPDELKGDNAVEAYRRFYHKDKATFAEWKYRDKPQWWLEEEADYESRITR